jgi:acyl-coenzyme A synthetase/AMP-(fatty) acid ligase
MVSRLHELKVDWVDCLSPGQLNMLVELVDERDFPTLPFKHVMSSGEALPVAVAAAFLKRFPGTSIGNCLSTTETAADACCLKEIPLALCEAMLADEESIRMAKSAATDEIETPAVSYVPVLRMCADNFGTLRSDSVVWGNALGRAAESGERLLVKGWNVEPTGYLTDEDSNAFMPRQLASEVDRGDKAAASEDPLSSVVGCFYSGDRAVWRQFKGMGSDTYLCIEGRVDDVVKVWN